MGTLRGVNQSLLEDSIELVLRKAFPIAFALLLLSGCGDCKGWIEIARGSFPLQPGESVQLEFYFDQEPVSTAEQCGGFWYVDGIEGGDAAVGTVTPCGLYTAPLIPPATPPVVMAATYALNSCADCCPYATLEIPLAPLP